MVQLDTLSLSLYLSLSFGWSGHVSCGHRAVDTEEGLRWDSWQGAGQKVEGTHTHRGEDRQKV